MAFNDVTVETVLEARRRSVKCMLNESNCDFLALSLSLTETLMIPCMAPGLFKCHSSWLFQQEQF